MIKAFMAVLIALSNWFHRRRVLRLLKSECRIAVYCQYWGRAHNLLDRIDRVMGKPKQYRLAQYQEFKQSFVSDLNWNDKWEFDRYSLS